MNFTYYNKNKEINNLTQIKDYLRIEISEDFKIKEDCKYKIVITETYKGKSNILKQDTLITNTYIFDIEHKLKGFLTIEIQEIKEDINILIRESLYRSKKKLVIGTIILFLIALLGIAYIMNEKAQDKPTGYELPEGDGILGDEPTEEDYRDYVDRNVNNFTLYQSSAFQVDKTTREGNLQIVNKNAYPIQAFMFLKEDVIDYQLRNPGKTFIEMVNDIGDKCIYISPKMKIGDSLISGEILKDLEVGQYDLSTVYIKFDTETDIPSDLHTFTSLLDVRDK